MCEVVHDARGEHLIAQSRAPTGAGAWVDDVARTAHVVHVGLARVRIDRKRALGVARDQHVLLRARRECSLDHDARDCDAATFAKDAAGRQQELTRGRRLDAHAGAFQQGKRRDMHRLDRFIGPEGGELGHAASLRFVET